MRTADSHETDLVVRAMPAPPAPVIIDVPDVTLDSDMLGHLHLLVDSLMRCFVAGRVDTLTPEEWHIDMPTDLRRAADLYEKYGALLMQAQGDVAGAASE